jgi:hypothetical protein
MGEPERYVYRVFEAAAAENYYDLDFIFSNDMAKWLVDRASGGIFYDANSALDAAKKMERRVRAVKGIKHISHDVVWH